MALIPPFFLNCVVAIGIDNPQGKRQWIASGFLYAHYLRGEGEDKTYRTYLVTNRHVVEGKEKIYLLFNPKVSETVLREYPLDLIQSQQPTIAKYHVDPKIDLAVVRVNVNILVSGGIEFSCFRSDEHVAAKESLSKLGISEGDFGYVLGFPMGLIGKERSFVIVRHGTIARIRDYLSGLSKEILMDCLIFPGNSGGPVVSKPELIAIKGTKVSSSAYLLGVVRYSISYQDVAISTQTKRPRLIFEDNSGLASIVPIQYLTELIETLQTEEEPKQTNDSNHN